MTAVKSQDPLNPKTPFIKDFLLILGGVILYTFGWTAFILSQNITSGGLAGITTIIQLATNDPAGYSYKIINGILIILAIVVLGWKFSFRTIISVALLFITIDIGQALFTPFDSQGMEVYNNLPELYRQLPHVGPLLAPQEPFLALVLGAIICGIGLGMVFSANSSTGGTDIVVAIINKYSNISLGRVMIALDAVIVTCGAIVSHYWGPQYSWDVALGKLACSIVEAVLVGVMLDMVMNRNKQVLQFLVFSTQAEAINKEVTEKLRRGSTLLHAEGGYTKMPSKVLIIIAHKQMAIPIYHIIKKIDPEAFVTESQVRSVYGEGFDVLLHK